MNDFGTFALAFWLDQKASRRSSTQRVAVRGALVAREWRVQLLETGQLVGEGRGAELEIAISDAMNDAQRRICAAVLDDERNDAENGATDAR